MTYVSLAVGRVEILILIGAYTFHTVLVVWDVQVPQCWEQLCRYAASALDNFPGIYLVLTGENSTCRCLIHDLIQGLFTFTNGIVVEVIVLSPLIFVFDVENRVLVDEAVLPERDGNALLELGDFEVLRGQLVNVGASFEVHGEDEKDRG